MKSMIKKNLIIVDFQFDLAHPSGAFPVPDGMSIKDPINQLLKKGKFDFVVATKNVHPQNYYSFKNSKNNILPPDLKILPMHCIAGLPGQELMIPPEYDVYIDYILNKGRNKNISANSAFRNIDIKTGKIYPTGLGDILRPRNADVGYLERYVYICGLAFDRAVMQTALDAKVYAHNVFVISDATRAMNASVDNVDGVIKKLMSREIKVTDIENAI